MWLTAVELKKQLFCGAGAMHAFAEFEPDRPSVS